ncbi:longevity assurance proteins LAG1/LAC1, partial [Atractiella rhizophila]
SSLKLLVIIGFLYGLFEYPLAPFVSSNPLQPLVFPSYKLEPIAEDGGVPKYGKGLKDIVFLLFGIIVFSFVRQSFTLWVCKPFARWMGIKSEAKLSRFMEQGYAVFYFGCTTIAGLYVMSRTPTWWYDTKHFWIGYPHWRMNLDLKAYYLIQFSYWLQQALVLVLLLEKPRSDFYELIGHHIVTLWLIGWSYGINLNQIGCAVFVSMDWADTSLALAKCFNYLKYEMTANTLFVLFIGTWSYFRIYQNIRILISVWFEFDLIPAYAKQFTPHLGVWLTWWMKYQIFVPLFLLLCLNLCMYFLIWRIAFRTIFRGKSAEDEREEGESDDEEDLQEKKKK